MSGRAELVSDPAFGEREIGLVARDRQSGSFVICRHDDQRAGMGVGKIHRSADSPFEIARLGQDAFRFHNLPGDYTGTMWSQTYRNYQSYVFVNGTALRALVNQYMNPYLTDITADMQHVSHDTTVNNLPVESDSAGEEATGDGQSASD